MDNSDHDDSVGQDGDSNNPRSRRNNASRVNYSRMASPPAEGGTPAKLDKQMQFCNKILHKLMRTDYYGWFTNPVVPTPQYAPDYFEIVQTPMDYSTVQKKLNAGQYSSPEDFTTDMLLIYDNAVKYNGTRDEGNKAGVVGRQALEYRSQFVKDMADMPGPDAGTSTTKKSTKKTKSEADIIRQRYYNTPMTFPEKKLLRERIAKMEPSRMQGVIKIVREDTTLQTKEGQVEICLDKLKVTTLRKMEEYVCGALGEPVPLLQVPAPVPVVSTPPAPQMPVKEERIPRETPPKENKEVKKVVKTPKAPAPLAAGNAPSSSPPPAPVVQAQPQVVSQAPQPVAAPEIAVVAATPAKTVPQVQIATTPANLAPVPMQMTPEDVQRQMMMMMPMMQMFQTMMNPAMAPTTPGGQVSPMMNPMMMMPGMMMPQGGQPGAQSMMNPMMMNPMMGMMNPMMMMQMQQMQQAQQQPIQPPMQSQVPVMQPPKPVEVSVQPVATPQTITSPPAPTVDSRKREAPVEEEREPEPIKKAEPEAVKMPEPEAVKMPEPEAVKMPEPEQVNKPEVADEKMGEDDEQEDVDVESPGMLSMVAEPTPEPVKLAEPVTPAPPKVEPVVAAPSTSPPPAEPKPVTATSAPILQAAAPMMIPTAAPVMMPTAAPIMMPSAAPVMMPTAAPILQAAAPLVSPAALTSETEAQNNKELGGDNKASWLEVEIEENHVQDKHSVDPKWSEFQSKKREQNVRTQELLDMAKKDLSDKEAALREAALREAALAQQPVQSTERDRVRDMMYCDDVQQAEIEYMMEQDRLAQQAALPSRVLSQRSAMMN